MTDHAVTIEAQTATPPSDKAVDALLDALTPHSGSVAGGPPHTGWSATIAVDAKDPARAAVAGQAIALEAAAEAGIVGSSIIAVDAVTYDELERRLAKPLWPEFIGAAEAADILKVSRQRIHQLHTDNPRFPKPAIEVRMGPLWTRNAIEAFDETWSRKPGRPAAATGALQEAARSVDEISKKIGAVGERISRRMPNPNAGATTIRKTVKRTKSDAPDRGRVKSR